MHGCAILRESADHTSPDTMRITRHKDNFARTVPINYSHLLSLKVDTSTILVDMYTIARW